MSITTVLSQLREDREIYQKELAAYLNVSVGTISNYEKGVHQPDLDTLIKLAKFYGVTTDYLLGLTKYPNRPEILLTHIAKGYPVARFLQLLEGLSEPRRIFLAQFLRFMEDANGLSPGSAKSTETSKGKF